MLVGLLQVGVLTSMVMNPIVELISELEDSVVLVEGGQPQPRARAHALAAAAASPAPPMRRLALSSSIGATPDHDHSLEEKALPSSASPPRRRPRPSSPSPSPLRATARDPDSPMIKRARSSAPTSPNPNLPVFTLVRRPLDAPPPLPLPAGREDRAESKPEQPLRPSPETKEPPAERKRKAEEQAQGEGAGGVGLPRQAKPPKRELPPPPEQQQQQQQQPEGGRGVQVQVQSPGEKAERAGKRSRDAASPRRPTRPLVKPEGGQAKMAPAPPPAVSAEGRRASPVKASKPMGVEGSKKAKVGHASPKGKRPAAKGGPGGGGKTHGVCGDPFDFKDE
jgi:serine/arginine repetitive matrix protein 1